MKMSRQQGATTGAVRIKEAATLGCSRFWAWSFLLWYIKNAACDVVYSDYIRLVNSYLPDVCDPKKFFVADVLTRIPVNYLGRIINVQLFRLFHHL